MSKRLEFKPAITNSGDRHCCPVKALGKRRKPSKVSKSEAKSISRDLKSNRYFPTLYAQAPPKELEHERRNDSVLPDSFFPRL